MKRREVLLTPEYWITKIQVMLYDCADKFMSKTGKNRAQLAEHLGVSKGYVSQVLNGDYDHRLSKFVELSLAFGYVPQVRFVPIEQFIQKDTHSFKSDTSTQFTTNIKAAYKKIETAA